VSLRRWDDQFRILPAGRPDVPHGRFEARRTNTIAPTPDHRTNSRTESGKQKLTKFFGLSHMNSQLPVSFLLVGLSTTTQVRVI
jgi:hypothetical protein